jgi:hypothetical protein
MIEVKEETDGSLTISWDENDPVERQLNTWTEQDFIKAITDHLDKLKNEEQETQETDTSST